MNLMELTAAVGRVIGPELAAGFTGQVSVTIDLRQGNICKVSIRREHDLRARTSDGPPAVEVGARREGAT